MKEVSIVEVCDGGEGKFGPSGDKSHSVLFSSAESVCYRRANGGMSVELVECKKRKKSDWAGLTLKACTLVDKTQRALVQKVPP